MVSPEHDLVVAFNAMVPDYEYDPEFDLFKNYILRPIEDGPNYTRIDSIPLLVNEILVVVIIAPIAVAATYMFVLRRRIEK